MTSACDCLHLRHRGACTADVRLFVVGRGLITVPCPCKVRAR